MDCTVSTKRETVFLRSGVKGRKTGASCRCAAEKIRVSFIAVKMEEYSGSGKRLATEITQDELAKIKPEIDEMLRGPSTAEDMTAFGAAARTIGGKTYMAIGMTVEPTKS